MAEKSKPSITAKNVADQAKFEIRRGGYLWFEFLKQTIKRISISKINFTLGFFACFIVVVIVALLITITQRSPVIFLRLAELQQGEVDLKVSAGDWTGRDTLNYTLAQQILTQSNNRFSFASPRLFIDNVGMISTRDCVNTSLNPADRSWKYFPNGRSTNCSGSECFYDVCPEDLISTGSFLVINSDRERELDLGRDWKLPAVPQNQVYLKNSLAKLLDAAIGDIIYIDIDTNKLGSFWKNLLQQEGIDEETLSRTRHIIVPFTVAQTYEDPAGKYGIDKSAAIVELSFFYAALLDNMSPELDPFLPQLGAISYTDFSQQVVINLPPPRVDTYLSTDYDINQKQTTEFASQVLYVLGFSQLETDLFVILGLRRTRFFGLFLGLILNVVIVILLFLSILLIYSLLMINVETRTFEFGVMRMIGTTRAGIIEMLMFQAFSYAIPSWALALTLAQIVSVGIMSWLKTITGVTISPLLTSESILAASGLGLLIPILAAIFPIRQALSYNLQDSLDVRRSKTSAYKISVHRSEPLAISWAAVITGILLAVFGFGVYYIIPLALISANFALLLNLFFFLLLGMILGLVLLSLNVQSLLAKFLILTFLFWEKTAVTKLVRKNLVAHTVRNRKTTIMFALSLGFIIFVMVAYSLSIDSFTYEVQQEAGTLVSVSGNIRIISELEEFCQENSFVLSTSWISGALENHVKNLTNYQLENIGRVFSSDITLRAASPNLFNTTLRGFLQIEESVETLPGYSLVEHLYTEDGSKSVVVGTLQKDLLGVKLEDHLVLSMTILNSSDNPLTPTFTDVQKQRLKVSAFVNAAPFFLVSKYPAIDEQDVIVSFPTFRRIANLERISSIQMTDLLIRLKEDISETDKDNFLKSLQELISSNQRDLEIFDFRETVAPITTANEIMSYLFNFTTLVAMLISFFSLTASMFTNIREQSKEIGVLRAMGIPKFWIYRIYAYEAFVVILSSSILGLIIGVVVGWTMTLQRVLFTALPVPFVFPYVLMAIIFGSSVILGILASAIPSKGVLGIPIVEIMKMLN